MNSIIGKGTYSNVYSDKVNFKGSIVDVAEKIFKKNEYIDNSYLNELDILTRLKEHTNVVSLIEFNPHKVSLSMELMHGSLEDWIYDNRKNKEKRTGYMQKIYFSIKSALIAIHNLGIIHNDVKPGNVLYKSYDDYDIFKLADFGMSGNLPRVELQGEVGGTYAYSSPQALITDGYSVDYNIIKNDYWSLGIIMLEVYLGFYPLLEGNYSYKREEILQSIYQQLNIDDRDYLNKVVMDKIHDDISLASSYSEAISLLPELENLLRISSEKRTNTKLYSLDDSDSERVYTDDEDLLLFNMLFSKYKNYSINVIISTFDICLRLKTGGVKVTERMIALLINLTGYQSESKYCKRKREDKDEYAELLKLIDGYFASDYVTRCLNLSLKKKEDWYQYYFPS